MRNVVYIMYTYLKYGTLGVVGRVRFPSYKLDKVQKEYFEESGYYMGRQDVLNDQRLDFRTWVSLCNNWSGGRQKKSKLVKLRSTLSSNQYWNLQVDVQACASLQPPYHCNAMLHKHRNISNFQCWTLSCLFVSTQLCLHEILSNAYWNLRKAHLWANFDRPFLNNCSANASVFLHINTNESHCAWTNIPALVQLLYLI